MRLLVKTSFTYETTGENILHIRVGYIFNLNLSQMFVKELLELESGSSMQDTRGSYCLTNASIAYNFL